MTLRTVPGRFDLKRFGCLATATQKWSTIADFAIFTLFGRVKAFFNRYVTDAENWVPRPKIYPLSNVTLSFL
jgi:hypothetical protein